MKNTMVESNPDMETLNAANNLLHPSHLARDNKMPVMTMSAVLMKAGSFKVRYSLDVDQDGRETFSIHLLDLDSSRNWHYS